MKLTEELIAAFRATRYEVQLPGQRAQLQVDTASETLRHWMKAQGHSCAALLTAHNPEARHRDAKVNHAAQQRLHGLLRERGLVFHTGCNVDPQQHWPAEDSVLVADLPLQQALMLAAQFGQLAILWCDTSGVPQLHFAAPG